MNDLVELRVRELSIAQGALGTIGDILFRRHMSADLDELSKGDIEGLSLAVCSIATLMGDIVTDFDEAFEKQEVPE